MAVCSAGPPSFLHQTRWTCSLGRPLSLSDVMAALASGCRLSVLVMFFLGVIPFRFLISLDSVDSLQPEIGHKVRQTGSGLPSCQRPHPGTCELL